MTKTNTMVAKVGVAFVATAMLLSMAAPAKAATIEELQAMIASLTAQLAALSGGSSATTGAYTFTRSLTVGSQGADVTALQNFLISKGHAIPAGATGYYGAQTVAAVAAWQAAAGITPAVGYFGPVSQAKYAAMVTTTTPGTTSTVGLTGSAGSVTVSSEASDLETEIAAGNSEKVAGFKVQSTGSDVNLTNTSVTLNITGTGSTYIEKYVDSVSVYMGGDKIGSIDAADFTRDSSGKYTANIALTDTVVKMGSSNRESFFISVKAVSTVDTADVAKALKFAINSIRFNDASGAILTDTTVASNASSNTFNVKKTSDTEKVKISLSDSPSGTIAIEDTTTTEVTLMKFSVKAEGTDVKFDTVPVTITNSNTGAITNLYLKRGSTKLADLSTTTVSSGSVVTFSLYDQETVDADDSETYTVVAKVVKGSTATGYTLSATLGNVSFENAAGNDLTETGSAAGNTLTLIGTGLTASDFTATNAATSDTNGKITKQVISYSFKLSAKGNTFYVPKLVSATGATTTANTEGATFVVAGATGITSTSSELSVAGVTLQNSTFPINDGETKTVTGTVTVTASTTSGYVRITLDDILGMLTSTGATTTLYTVSPATNFQSAQYSIY